MSRFRNLVKKVAQSGPVESCLRFTFPSDGILALMYHEMAPDGADTDAWSVVREGDFLRQMEHVRKHFDLIRIEEALRRRATGDLGPRPVAVVTFDDGNAGNCETLLKLVAREELPVAIFVSTEHIVAGRCYWFDAIVNALQNRERLDLDFRDLALGRYELNKTRGRDNWARINKFLSDLKNLDPRACAGNS
jgi:hypothetical protein